MLVRDFDKTFLDTEVSLPIVDNHQINYAFMEILISAIKKMVIKDVVLYADRKIEATKSVVNQ